MRFIILRYNKYILFFPSFLSPFLPLSHFTDNIDEKKQKFYSFVTSFLFLMNNDDHD